MGHALFMETGIGPTFASPRKEKFTKISLSRAKIILKPELIVQHRSVLATGNGGKHLSLRPTRKIFLVVIKFIFYLIKYEINSIIVILKAL